MINVPPQGAAQKALMPGNAPARTADSTQPANANANAGMKPVQGGKIQPPARGQTGPSNAASPLAATTGNRMQPPASGSTIAQPASPGAGGQAPVVDGAPAPRQTASEQADAAPSDSAAASRVDQAIAAVANGEVEALPDIDFSTQDTSGLRGLSTTVALAISSTDDESVERGQAAYAGIRAQLAADGATAPQLAELDAKVAFAAEQNALAIADDPAADPDVLDAAFDDLRTNSLDAFRRTDRARSDRLAAAEAEANAAPPPFAEDIDGLLAGVADGSVSPTEGTDLSALNTVGLRFQAAAGAEALGRGVASGDDAAVSENLGRIAGLREQLQQDGADTNDLAEFDAALSTLATQSALLTSEDPAASVEALDSDFENVVLGPLDAFDRTDRARLDRLNGTIDAPVEARVDAAVEVALSGQITPLFDTDFSTASAGELIGRTSDGLASIAFGELNDNPIVAATGQGLIAGVRQQLESDGATPAGLAEFDAAVRDSADTFTREQLGEAVTEDDFPDLGALQVFGATETTRFLRQNRNPDLSDENAASIDEAIADAIADSGEAEFTSGDLTLASTTEINNILTVAAGDIAEGIVENNEQTLANGQNFFGAVRQELIENRNATEAEIETLDSRFTLSAQENLVSEEGGINFQELAGARQEIIDAVDAAVQPNDPFVEGARLKDAVSFEGDNGAPPVTIFTIDLETMGEQGTGGPVHQEAVENVIEEQLQAAGQSYSLTNLEVFRSSNAELNGDSTALARVAEAAPDYLNRSIILPVEPDFLTDGLRQLADAGSPLVEGLDLGEGVSQANLDDFRGVIREFALNFDELGADLDLDTADRTRWEGLGEQIETLEAVIAVGTDVFQSVPNDSVGFAGEQFVSDEGLAGSITFVGNIGTVNTLESDDFESDLDQLSRFENDGIVPGREGSFYRGEGVDVFAPGSTPSGAFGQAFGTSFATPDLLVNAALGRFDPRAETPGAA